MVPSIARQSVIIKCNMQKSILTGNYEFYYAAGLIANLSGVEIPEDIKPEELLALLSEKIPTLTPADEKEKYLFGMVADYRPEDVYDEQMRELLDWGRTENISGRSHCRMTGRTHKARGIIASLCIIASLGITALQRENGGRSGRRNRNK